MLQNFPTHARFWLAGAVLAFALSFSLPVSPALAADEAQAAIDKANSYIELMRSTERAVDSWDRYKSWVNMKTGPTGKERYIDYGLYDVSDIEGLVTEVRKVAANPPKAAKLDAALERYIPAYEALAPLLNEAAAYYDSKAYQQDKLAKGKALHAKMVPLATAFLAEREAMMPELRAFIREVEGQEVTALEARDGRTAIWHAANVMHRVNRVLDVFPRVRPEPIGDDDMEAMMSALGPESSGEEFDKIIAGVKVPKTPALDVKAYNESLKAYAEAVAGFEAYKGALPEDPDDFNEFKPMPKKMLQMLTAFGEPLAKSKGEEFEGGAQMTGQIYNHYIEMLNASSPLQISQLRFLP